MRAKLKASSLAVTLSDDFSWPSSKSCLKGALPDNYVGFVPSVATSWHLITKIGDNESLSAVVIMPD